ncbi:BnaAnng16800D [Brassica napus]|uniref:BnaAnng16800D protein n=2 Tax=Brassica napus TaxID=3708 RepID=A0A078J997_BRANA|nr:BnaAnng16800D [Brassica napus]
MKNTNAKLITLVVGFLVLMMMMNLHHALQGGNIDVGGSKYEDYGLMVSRSEPLLMGRKLKSSKPIESGTKKRSTKGLPSTDSAKEIDNLMRGDYSSLDFYRFPALTSGPFLFRSPFCGISENLFKSFPVREVSTGLSTAPPPREGQNAGFTPPTRVGGTAMTNDDKQARKHQQPNPNEAKTNLNLGSPTTH